MTLLTACNNGGNTPPAGKADGNKPAVVSPAPAPATPAAPAAAPAEVVPAPTQAGGSLKGKVLETMNVAGYTYLQLETGSGPQWVAIPETALAVGQEVECQPGMVMAKFHSQGLNRDFDSIVFSAGLAGGARSPHGAPAKTAASPAQQEEGSFAEALQQEKSQPQAKPGAEAMEVMGSAGSMGAVVPFAELKVDKAQGENAQTVADIFARSAELGQKKVRVRGKVVKLSRMIMGKNWVHVQDGTGDPMTNSHDLVFTTLAEPEQGQIVTLEGTLEVGKDFGYGYKYAVLVEDAVVVGQ
ncbi:MAG: hypothetical protein BWK76_20270 [Desulfobulbaceae bacterium A2]|nr:MAG: hypothetical protein BWK76_20270 [Desulfobulbaceae bacterium A2]